MAQVDNSDMNAILSAVTDMSSPITDYAVHTNKSSNILQHNMRISADTNSPLVAQPFNEIASDVQGAGEGLARLAGLNQLAGDIHKSREDTAKNLLYNEYGNPVTNIGTETLRMGAEAIPSILASVATDGISLMPTALSEAIANPLVGSGALSASMKLASKAIKTAEYGLKTATPYAVDSSIASSYLTEPHMDNNHISVPKVTGKDLALGSAMSIIPVEGMRAFMGLKNSITKKIVNKGLYNKLNKANYGLLHTDVPAQVNRSFMENKLLPAFKKELKKQNITITDPNEYEKVFSKFLDDNGFKIDNGGFIKLQDGITINDISTNILSKKNKQFAYGAFKDTNGDVLIKTPKLGTLVGTIGKDNKIIIDVSKSKLKNINFAIDKTPILSPFKQAKAFMNDSASTGSKSFRTEFRVKTTKDKNIVVDGENIKYLI